VREVAVVKTLTLPRMMLIVCLGLFLAACQTTQPRPTLPLTSAPGITQGGFPKGIGPANSNGGPSDPGAAALNKRLLRQMAQQPPDTDLPLGAGDLIEISVLEVEELSKFRARIPLRGAITLPLLGALPAANRTTIELEDDIRQRLRRTYMHDPQVSVFLEEQKSQRISVVGAVNHGGVFTMSSRLRLADALALAGGLTSDADHRVYVIRHLPAEPAAQASPQAEVQRVSTAAVDSPTATPLPTPELQEAMVAIDLEALTAGRAELNLPLLSGDVIHIPWAGSYYIGGEVGRPGSFPLKSRTTLDQALIAAGGVKDVADWDDIRLYRPTDAGEPDVLQFSLNDFEQGKAAPELRKNDIIMVGKSQSKAVLYGLRDFFRFSWGASVPIP
jgi:polysaccharide biosynthesis/export protein